MRNNRVVDWQFMYDYAVSKGFNLGVQSFNMGANMLLMEINNILISLDHEYDLTLLYDKDNNFIRVIT